MQIGNAEIAENAEGIGRGWGLGMKKTDCPRVGDGRRL